MAQENNRHLEHGHAPRRGVHRDWRLWAFVGLMLAAMFAYVMSDDESLQFGGTPPQQTASPAAGP